MALVTTCSSSMVRAAWGGTPGSWERKASWARGRWRMYCVIPVPMAATPAPVQNPGQKFFLCRFLRLFPIKTKRTTLTKNVTK